MDNDELTNFCRLGKENELSCLNNEASFVYNKPNSEFPVGMQACCVGNECDFASACYNQARIQTDPSVTTSKSPFAVYCTNSKFPECRTWTYPDAYIKMECGSEAELYTVYTEAKWSNSANPAARSVTQEIKPTDDVFLAYISSTIMKNWGLGSTSTSSSGSAQGLPETPSPSTTLQTPQPSATDTEKSNSSTSPGAIAGGVVGGLVGGAAIAAAAIFFFLRRKKKIRQENEPSEELQETGYQAVPQNQPRHSSWLMPHVAEPESTYKPETSEPSTTGATPELYSPNSPAELPERHHR